MAEQDKLIRVMIVDDHDMVRKGLTVFVDTFDDMELVGEASDGEMAITLCEECHPDVILMDLLMPRMDGITAISHLTERYPTVHTIALTSSEDEELVHQAMGAGATGFLMKNASIHELADAIRKASVGQPVLSPEAMRALIRAATTPAKMLYSLTEREKEVLLAMSNGATNRQIAQDLSLSYATVKFYVSSILAKMDVSSRTEAVSLALKEGILDAD